MITTIVLIQADPRKIRECAITLAGIDGVAEVYSVSGAWDLVAIVRVADLEKIADVVTRAPDGPVDLHLNPEELGKVRISMAMVEGGINVTILAERPDTLDLMRRHIDQLAQEFRQLGYGLINFSFGQRNEGQENRSDGGRNLAVSATPEDTPRATPADGRHGQENGLDMRI